MSGRRIDDHSSWIGKGAKGSVFPEGVKVKEHKSAEGVGKLGAYEDSDEAIMSQQERGISKAKGHAMKAGFRN